jgi:hypothetical protein
MAPFRCVVLVYCKQRANFLLFFSKKYHTKKAQMQSGIFPVCSVPLPSLRRFYGSSTAYFLSY